jgi:mxaJ protein
VRAARGSALKHGAVLAALGAVAVMGCGPSGVLRVCADPNNMPFSNRAEQGFENKLAELVAGELDARVEYTWWAQRRGFLRGTVNAGECDLVVGIPTGMEMVRRTRPYYRSGYVFVTRADRAIDVRSLDDSLLRALRIGVPVVGDDYAATPPAAALIKRGLAANLVGVSVFGNYAEPDPPARLIDAVRRGDVDVAIAWGPLAGWFSRRGTPALRIVPVTPQVDLPYMPLVFDIAMGVRHADSTFAAQLDSIIVRRRGDIDRILASYGVPRLDNRAEVAGLR